MTCASCHDPHGSSNYRLLTDQVNGNTVGGYVADDAPTPYVISVEPGYPNGTTGDGTSAGRSTRPAQAADGCRLHAELHDADVRQGYDERSASGRPSASRA